MTTDEIKDFLITVDPEIERYESSKRDSDAYTVWKEAGPATVYADGATQEVMRFQVDRFTKTEDDTVAWDLFTALDARDDICLTYLVDYEDDTGYIHHIYDCEAV